MRSSLHLPASAGSLLGVALDDLAAAVRAARQRVLIATPFLSLPVAQLLVRAADTSTAREKRLLTAVNVAAVEGGYLDPFAVQAFVDAGFEVGSLRNLHAKSVLVDDAWGLVGSGNMTVAGANGGKAELGVVLTRTQARQARKEHFDAWWAHGKPVDIAALHRLDRHRPARPERRQRDGQGGMFSAPVGRELASFSRDRRNSGYWLKVMYGNADRAARASWKDVPCGSTTRTSSATVRRSVGPATRSATTMSPTSPASAATRARRSCASSTSRRMTRRP